MQINLTRGHDYVVSFFVFWALNFRLVSENSNATSAMSWEDHGKLDLTEKRAEFTW